MCIAVDMQPKRPINWPYRVQALKTYSHTQR